jgi:hypothetical protein
MPRIAGIFRALNVTEFEKRWNRGAIRASNCSKQIGDDCLDELMVKLKLYLAY